MSFKSTLEESQDVAHVKNTSNSKFVAAVADKLNYEQFLAQNSLMGKTLCIKGEVGANENLLIDGRVEGTIVLKHHRLEIGITGVIEANLYAKSVVINGEVRGNVYASDHVSITKSGRVFGNIYSADVNIEDGAILNGSIDMERQDISNQHSLADTEEEVETESKETSFGFLFRRSKDLPQLENDPFGTQHQVSETVHVTTDHFIHIDTSTIQKSLIGRSVIIKGELTADEDVVIMGELNGVVHLRNNNIDFAPQAKITSNVFARSVAIYGEMRGDVFASESIAIKKPGHVFGVMHAPRISIESGAVLMGSIEMQEQNIEELHNAFQKNNPVELQTHTTVQYSSSKY